MTLTTIINRLEEEQERLDKDPALDRLSNDYQHVTQRLTGALVLLYRIRSSSPLTLSKEIPTRSQECKPQP